MTGRDSGDGRSAAGTDHESRAVDGASATADPGNRPVGEARAGADAPVLRIVSGSPTDAELAAVHAVIAAALADQAAAGVPRLEPRADGWHQSARQMRGLLTPGPGAWNASRGVRGC